MKIDVISVVMFVFCLSICVALFVEFKKSVGAATAEAVVAHSH